MYRVLPEGFEFAPFDYYGHTVQIDDYGYYEVYDGKRFLGRFQDFEGARNFILDRALGPDSER